MRLNLQHVQEKCSKQGCSHVDAPLHRHHKKSQKMFLNCFRLRYRSKHYKLFKQHYENFRPRDVVKICDWHHREIHERYSVIVNNEKARLRKRLRNLSWKEAEVLMKKLEQECDRWLKIVTPGSPPWPAREGTG